MKMIISKDFLKRNSVWFGILIIVTIAFLFALPYQVKIGHEIGILNAKLQMENNIEKVIELKREIADKDSTHIIWTVILMIIFIPFAWSFRMLLDGLTLYSYTNIPFLKTMIEGDNKQFDNDERIAFMRVIASIPIANSLLILAVFVGIFFVFFS